MKDFSFSIPQNIKAGAGSIKLLPELAGELGKKKGFIISGPHLNKIGMVEKCQKALLEAGIECDSFTETEANPSTDTVEKAADKFRECGADFIVAFGGGSPIDVAKAVAVVVTYGGKITEYEGAGKVKGPVVPIIAIPTTAGTGSEVTSFAVITDKVNNIKYPLADYELTPDIAIIDPTFVMTVPRSVTADTGMDVLTHAIEAYVSIMATDYTDALAMKAIQMVFEYLPISYKGGNSAEVLEAREKMHNASCIAGMAFANAFLGVNHSLAHKLGGEFHIAHGRANAILLPHVIEYNATIPSKFTSFPKYKSYVADKKYAEIAKMLGLKADTTEEGVKSLVEAIRDLMRRLNVPLTVKECGIDQDRYMAEIERLAVDAFDDQCTGANPRLPLISELADIYRCIYE